MYFQYRPGNTRGLTDDQGNAVQKYFCDVYRQCWTVTSDQVNGYQYVGSPGVSADADDGLLYLQARLRG